MLLKDAVTKRSAALRRQGRSERTIEWYELWLQRLDDYLLFKDLDQITLTQLRCWVDDLIESGLQATSIRGAAMTAKVFFKWCVKEGYLKTNPAERLELMERPQRVPDTLTTSEVLALVNATVGSQNPERDLALVVFLTETGCRCSEVVNLQIGHLNVDGCCATVLGKGNKQRFVFFGEVTQRALRAWLEVRQVEGTSLFGLTEWGIRQALERLGDRVGVHANPHKFRRTSATLTADNGASAFFLQQKMGWASIDMAEYYVNRAQLEQRSRTTSPMDRLFQHKQMSN